MNISTLVDMVGLTHYFDHYIEVVCQQKLFVFSGIIEGTNTQGSHADIYIYKAIFFVTVPNYHLINQDLF